MRQFKRSDRIRSQMLRDIQGLLEHECSVNLEAMVTFTDVEITEDLKYAKIFYSVLGGEESKKTVSTYLDRIRNRVQSQLGNLLSIKHTPEIKFEFDPSVERGIRIQQLLNEISKEDDGRKKSDI